MLKVYAPQAGSPLFARRAYWSVVETVERTPNPFAVDGALEVVPYHAYVPSFGDWGFVMASAEPLPNPGPLPDGLQFYSSAIWPTRRSAA